MAAAAFVPAAGAQEDVTPPALVELSLSPATIDTSGAEQTITVTAHITDDLAGFASGRLLFRTPSGATPLNAFFFPHNLVSGTLLDGVYETTLRVPRFSEQGTWTGFFFPINDAAGNFRNSFEPAPGFPATFEQTGAGDTTAPVLEQVSLAPTSVDTSGADQTITVSARITDDLAGFEFGRLLFRSPSGIQFFNAFFFPHNLVSGTLLDGVYETTLRVPRFSEQGTWTGFFFPINDAAGNFRNSFEPAPGFPATFEQTGPGDTAGPVLVEVSLSPASVDTSGADQDITVTAHITDDLAGFQFGRLLFRSPSNAQMVQAFFTMGNLVSGTALDGIYETTLRVPRFSELGTWTGDFFPLNDEAGNFSGQFGGGSVPGFPASFEVALLTPEARIAAVASALEAIVQANPGGRLADKVEDALAAVRTARSELEKTPPDDRAAVGNIEGAVGDLQAAHADGLIDALQLMDELAGVARQLAADAIEAARAGSGDPAAIERAEQSLTDGDALRVEQRFKDAVAKYKAALAQVMVPVP